MTWVKLDVPDQSQDLIVEPEHITVISYVDAGRRQIHTQHHNFIIKWNRRNRIALGVQDPPAPTP